MSTRPKFFLLDAGPVIELHRLDLWSAVSTRAELVVPSIAAKREVIFYPQGEGVGRPIRIQKDADAGRVGIAHAEAASMAETLARFDPTMQERIDEGELEALALICSWSEPCPAFCSADRMATIALCLLGKANLAVSLEGLLRLVGLGRPVQPKFSDDKMKQWLEEGRRRLIQGEGLALRHRHVRP